MIKSTIENRRAIRTSIAGSNAMGQSSGNRRTVELLARLMGAGWAVALSIAGGAGGGFWLDGQFDTSPVLTLVGLAIGIVVAFAGMIRILSAMWNGNSDGSAGEPGNGARR
ncbi:MAG: AtpZ/AtpI family protein [Dehalococcoidia bacterium]|nr:AtpZ/AtpI family protein [Dehalococcoidia bacterium]